MYTLIVVLIVIACIFLMAVVLIQNPKGGGLGQTFGGFSNQILGVQRTTDVLEKATWYAIVLIAVLSISTLLFIGKPGTTTTGPKSALENTDLGGPAIPTQQAPPPAAPAGTLDSTGN